MLIVRENSEGLYSGRERADGGRGHHRAGHHPRGLGAHRAPGLPSWPSQRRGLLTIVHKANVLRATCGLFREVAFERGRASSPTCSVEEMLVDTAAMRLITDPERFDVLVTTNLFGDILSDEAAALVGGLGLAPSGNIGDERGHL